MSDRAHSFVHPTGCFAALIIFGLLGVLSATQLWVGIQSEGPGGIGLDVTMARLLAWQVGHWLGWGVLTPLILLLGERYPLAVGRLLCWVLHVSAAVGMAVVHTLLSTAWLRFVAPFGTDPRPFAEHVVGRLSSLLQLDLLVYAAILGVAYAVSYYRRLRAREVEAAHLQAQLAEARLESLTAQLQPHFLFNTLHGVAGLVRDGRGSDAIDMLEGISDLLRYSLQTRHQPKVTLDEEMAILRKYLEIQRVRYGDRLHTEIEVSPRAGAALVPALLLQPLAENSIRHGVARTRGPFLLRVSADDSDGRLRLRITDSGPGLAAGHDEQPGVGLTNTRNRLRQLYGDACRLDLEPAEPGGTVATVEIPLEVSGG